MVVGDPSVRTEVLVVVPDGSQSFKGTDLVATSFLGFGVGSCSFWLIPVVAQRGSV